jgi:hypothetical protein
MRARRRGIVLVLVLAMLGLLALVGVTFATLSGRGRIDARNYAQSLLKPQDDELMDFALAQLITDTSDPRSVIRGHSLARDMYGNDANGDGYLPLNPSTGLPFYVTDAAQVAGSTYTLTTNIVSGDPNFYGYNFTRWIMRVSYAGALGTATGAVDQTFEILTDTGFIPGSNAARVLTAAILDTTTTLANPNTNLNFPNGYLTALPGSYLAALVAAGNGNNLGVQFPFGLDGRWLRAFNGPGIGSQSTQITVGGATINIPCSTYGNFRYNGALGPIMNGPIPVFPTPGAVGMDEDYDACDLENWFLAIQSADGQVMIPSFHRPGIIRDDPGNNVHDWPRLNQSGPGGTLLWAESASRFLRPCQADGHDSNTFPDLLPNANGKIDYDVDNDGDGVTDSVWLDLGYPARRDSRGKLYKPLFAFMVIGLNGRIPLNTAGNVAGNSLGTGETHAIHLGNSVSEVDPRYALQNAFLPPTTDPTTTDPALAFQSPPGSALLAQLVQAGTFDPTVNAFNSQVDSGGIDVRLTQLRSLLSGTRPQPDAQASPGLPNYALYPSTTDPNGATNGDDNVVFYSKGATKQQPYFMPNGIAEAIPVDAYAVPPLYPDANGNPQVLRITPPVPGRWGEAQAVPGVPFIGLLGNYVNLVNQIGYTNPVRAGYSQDIGDTLNLSPRDAADDNFNSFDPFPPYDAVTALQRAGEVDDSELYDAAGAFLLPIDRMRRWLTPADINGTGSVRTWTAAAGGPGSPVAGPDNWGRVEHFSYYRPPGAPGTVNVNYNPFPNPIPAPINTTPTPLVAGTNLGAVYYPTSANANFYTVGPNPNMLAPNPGAVPPAPMYPYLPDLTNNPLHGFESFKVPNLVALGGGYNPQNYGGMPIDLPPGVNIATGYPTYNAFVSAKARSDGLNEADEMNLYSPNAQLDAPFGPGDLEWLYRQQDVDGSSLSSRLAKLAPISFTNGLDSQRRRRLFSLDSWEMNNFVWANDNPSGVFPNNSRFLPLQNASFQTLNPLAAMPSNLAQRDKKINLNYPLPVSNSPDEPVRRKWVSDTYQLLKVVLPPRAVDTPEELAQLSQFVINIIDFRDPDCTMTHFQNPDVELALGSITVVGGVNTYAPPKMYLKGGSPAGSTVLPLDQFGMEYNPIAINETMAFSFLRKFTDPITNAVTPTPTPRFFVELVNTLTKSVGPVAPFVDASTIDLGVNNYDLCITTDDAASRPDPFTGQLLPIVNTTAPPLATVFGPIPLAGTAPSAPGNPPPTMPVYQGGVNVQMTPLDPTAPPPYPIVPTQYFNVIANALPDLTAQKAPTLEVTQQTLSDNFDPTSATQVLPPGIVVTPPTPAPGALTLDPTTAAVINGVTIGLKNAYAPKPWMCSAINPGGQPLAKGETRYYWVCLRRPASPFLPPNPDITGLTGPYNPMIVVDSMRFPYIEGGGTATTAGGVDMVTQGNNTLYSAERAQPYRGGHAVRLPGDAGTSSAVLNTPYGYSEQTMVPGVQVADYGLYGTGPTNIITQTTAGPPALGFYHTIGAANVNAVGAAEPWDWFIFHDRDFSNVAELMLVPGCPPGLFTKQFVELPPMVPSVTPVINASGFYTNFPVPGTPGTTFPPPNPPTPTASATAAPAVPNAYSYTAPTAGPLQPHTYPYLVDKFFYSGASLPAPTAAATTFADTDTPLQSINTAASDGWFKMLDFFEVPSQMNGAIGSVAQGTNFDWARQDIKPGLLNINLIIDEEVFFSVLGKQAYNTASLGLTPPADPFAQTWLNFAQLVPGNQPIDPTYNFPLNIPRVASVGLATGLLDPSRSYPVWTSGGVLTNDWLNLPVGGPPPTSALNNNALKAAFAQFLNLRHGGSGYLFGFNGERPFHSLSYPDIDFTVMRPATLPPAGGGAVSPAPPTLPPAAPGTPYASGSYAGDPGVRNPIIYPGGFASSIIPPAAFAPGTPFNVLATPNVILPPPVPALRLFQIPDAFGQTTTWPPTIPPPLTTLQSNASDSGDPFINVAQTTGALAPVSVAIGGVPTPFFLNNGYPNLVWSGNAPNNATATPAQPYLGGASAAPVFDYRQHPYWRLEMMQRVMNLTTPRTHQYAVWITVGFFEIIRQGDPGMQLLLDPRLAFDIMGPEVGAVTGKNVRYRGFFLVDRTKITSFNPGNTGSFRSAVVYRKTIQ